MVESAADIIASYPYRRIKNQKKCSLFNAPGHKTTDITASTYHDPPLERLGIPSVQPVTHIAQDHQLGFDQITRNLGAALLMAAAGTQGNRTSSHAWPTTQLHPLLHAGVGVSLSVRGDVHGHVAVFPVGELKGNVLYFKRETPHGGL